MTPARSTTRIAMAAFLTCAAASTATAGLGTSAPANPLLMGGNQNFANYDNLLNKNSFLAMIRALQMPNMRYIAGSPASFWDALNAEFVPEQEILDIWPDAWFVSNGANDWVNGMPASQFSVDRMDAAMATAGVSNIQWIANLTTREDDQDDLFTYLDAQGYNYDYIEADNEAFFWGSEFAAAGGGTEYGKRIANKLAPTVRALNPNAKIGADFRSNEFFTGESESGGFNANWNSNLYGQINRNGNGPHFDAIILHHYKMGSDGLSGYSTANRRQAFLAFPEATIERAARVAEEDYGDLPIWITEYNVIAYNGSGGGSNGEWIRSTQNTGWNAFYQAGFYLTAFANPDDIELMNHHAVRSGIWGMAKEISTSQAELNATGVIYAHVTDILVDAEEMMPVEPDNNPDMNITIVGDSDLNAFQAAALYDQDSETLSILVMNRDDAAHDFQLSDYGLYSSLDIVTYLADDPDANGYKTVSLTSRIPLYEQDAAPFQPTTSQQFLALGQPLDIELPAFSFSVLTLSGQEAPLAGDLNGDGVVDTLDINVLFDNLGSSDPFYDLNQDGSVDNDDVTLLVEGEDFINSFYGDANGDQSVDLLDLSALAADFDTAGHEWEQGDFNGDSAVNLTDLSILASNFGNTNAVPEPAAATLLLALAAIRRRR
ncbi:dockerin type I domain-containing protein [Mucisphaera calidilacus]|uniref:Dockerin domain-containing protein n=1 Tax=Mucisphaera calidilacus TaxID=2527982 RepID=A0A518BUG8_9BACT|nr:dockerin type I domain-containing protein [Mucisphaera calidilacus]QDU70630.1 hypothetical protein Pan265_04580 [Mucisphaera calidilacus]